MSNSDGKVIDQILNFCKNSQNSKNPVCKSLAVTEASQKPPLSSILNIIVRYTSGLDLTDEERDMAFSEFATMTKFRIPDISNVYAEVEKDLLYYINLNCFFIYIPLFIFFLIFIMINIGKTRWYILLVVFILFTSIIALFWLTYYYGVSYYFKANFSKFVDSSKKHVKSLERGFVDVLPGINKMSEKIEEIINNKT